MKQLEGFVAKGHEHLVCMLKHSLYGLKQSPRCWNSVLDKYLKERCFLQSASDPCIYVATEGKMFIVGVYVDDIIIESKNEEHLKRFKQALGEEFDVKDLGRLHYFLGIKIIQDNSIGDVRIGQPAYTNKVLEKFEMQSAKRT